MIQKGYIYKRKLNKLTGKNRNNLQSLIRPFATPKIPISAWVPVLGYLVYLWPHSAF